MPKQVISRFQSINSYSSIDVRPVEHALNGFPLSISIKRFHSTFCVTNSCLLGFATSPKCEKTTNQKPLRLFIQLQRTFPLSQKPNTRQELSGNTRKTLRGLTFLYSIKTCSFIQPPHVVCATDDELNESDLSRIKTIFNSPLLVVLSRKAYSILIHQVNNSTI